MPRQFPHLLRHEAELWAAFLRTAPFPVDSVQYDVHLGEGVPLDPNWPEWMKRMVKALTQKRVDAIVESGPNIWLVEIKVRAGFSALGQLLGYGLLYMAEFRPLSPPLLAVVAERLQPDISGVLANYNVTVFLVQR